MLYALRILEILAMVAIEFVPKLLGIAIAPQKWRRERILLISGECLRNLFEKLGPVYIKIGQFLSVRRDLLPHESIAPLKQLQDNVYPISTYLIKRAIANEYELALDDVFEEFDWKPVAVGSIAQVYRAKLKNSSEEVAVKVKRPGIDRIVDRDLKLIAWITQLLQQHSAMERIPLVQSIQFLCESIYEQLDFNRERFNTSTFAKLIHNPSNLLVPNMLDDYCRNSILVMKFESGLMKIDSPEIPEKLYQQAVLTLLRSLYKMIFTFGFIHCDFHPGNIFVNQNERLVILDFGMTARLSDSERIDFRDFFLAIVHNHGSTCADIMLRTAISIDENCDRQSFVTQVKDLIYRVSGQKAGNFRITEFVYQLFDIQRIHKICGSPSFTMALISLIQFEGLVIHRFPTLDFQKEARIFFTSALVESVHRIIA